MTPLPELVLRNIPILKIPKPLVQYVQPMLGERCTEKQNGRQEKRSHITHTPTSTTRENR